MRNFLLLLPALFLLMAAQDSCNPEPMSTSGVSKATATVVVGADGLTTEQRNIQHRTEQDNLPGGIQHLYVISAYSGQVLIYSTVQGKVTSSGKRLTPSTVASDENHGFSINFNGLIKSTYEVLGDDGTYGSSEPYIYWYDVQGRYHQLYVSGGQIITISDQPIAVKNITINMEITNQPVAADPYVEPQTPDLGTCSKFNIKACTP